MPSALTGHTRRARGRLGAFRTPCLIPALSRSGCLFTTTGFWRFYWFCFPALWSGWLWS